MDGNSNVTVKDFFINVLAVIGAVGILFFGYIEERKISKLEASIATHARSINTITQVVNKQGRAMSAIVEEVGLDVEEITK